MARKPAPKAGKAAKDPDAVPAMELRAFLAQQTPWPACVVVLGEEAFLRDEARAALTDGLPATAAVEHEGRTAELAAVLDDARTLPFLGDRRVVIVRDAADLVANEAEGLGAYLERPLPTGTLVLECPKLDRRKNVVKSLLAASVVVACDAPDARGLERFVRARAERWGRPFARGAAEALLERLGGHDVALGTLDAEVQKLAAAGLAPDGGKPAPITAEDVAALCTVGSSEESFGIVDGVAAGDVGGTLARLASVLRDGLVANGERVKEPSAMAFMLLGLLRWDLGRLLRARAMLDAGQRPADITAELKVWRDKDRFLGRVQRATRDGLAARHELLRAADAALKSSGDPEVTLTTLLVRLARADKPPSRGGR